jgi:hypothetical protein
MKRGIIATILFLSAILIGETGLSTPSKLLNNISSRLFLGLRGDKLFTMPPAKIQQSDISRSHGLQGIRSRPVADACNIMATSIFFRGCSEVIMPNSEGNLT